MQIVCRRASCSHHARQENYSKHVWHYFPSVGSEDAPFTHRSNKRSALTLFPYAQVSTVFHVKPTTGRVGIYAGVSERAPGKKPRIQCGARSFENARALNVLAGTP